MSENNTAIVVPQNLVPEQELKHLDPVFLQDEEEDELDFPEDEFDEDLDDYPFGNSDEIDE